MKANDFGMIVYVSNPKIKTLKLLTIRRKKMSALPIKGKPARLNMQIVPNEKSEQQQYIFFIELP